MEFALQGIDTKTLSDQGVEMVVKQLDSDKPLLDYTGQTVSITVLGPDSNKYQDIMRAQIKKRLNRMAENKGKDETDLDEVEADLIHLLVSCTVSWKGIYKPDQTEIPCTPENARKLYANYPVLREQLDRFVGNRANFLQTLSGA